MLRLPIRDNPGLDTPCGLSAALILLEVVAGVSMELYLRPGEHRGNRKGGHELRFIEVLKKHFPWTHEPITPDDAAKFLYRAYRNPLAHNLGIVNNPNVKPAGIAIVGGNAPLPEEDIEAIERCANMPSGEPTLQRIQDATDRWKLNIWAEFADGADITGWLRVDTTDWSYKTFASPGGILAGYPFNIETGWVPLIPGAFWTGFAEGDQQIKEERQKAGETASLYLYNVITGQKLLVKKTNDPIWRGLKGKWLNDRTLQYETPSGTTETFTLPE